MSVFLPTWPFSLENQILLQRLKILFVHRFQPFRGYTVPLLHQGNVLKTCPRRCAMPMFDARRNRNRHARLKFYRLLAQI